MTLALRACWLAVTGLLSVAHATAPDPRAAHVEQWRFAVYLDDRHVGYHSYELIGQGEKQVVVSQAQYELKSGLFGREAFAQHAREIWHDGCLRGLDVITENDGASIEVVGREMGKDFEILTVDGATTIALSCVLSFAYWNRDILTAEQLLDPASGELVPVNIEPHGIETVETDSGPTQAQRYRIRAGESTVDVWYARDDQRWLALETVRGAGRTLRYRRI